MGKNSIELIPPRRPKPPELQELLTALLWVSNSDDYRPGGRRRWRWVRSVLPVINRLGAHLGYAVPGVAKPPLTRNV